MYITAFFYCAYKINKHNLQDEICGTFKLYTNSQNRNSLHVQWGVYSRCHNVTVIAVTFIETVEGASNVSVIPISLHAGSPGLSWYCHSQGRRWAVLWHYSGEHSHPVPPGSRFVGHLCHRQPYWDSHWTLSDDHLAESTNTLITTAVLEALACGTFAYITFLELIGHEFVNVHPSSQKHRLLLVLACLAGFILLAALTFLDD